MVSRSTRAPRGVIKANGPRVVARRDVAWTSMPFEIFCTFIDFRFTDALHIKWTMHQATAAAAAAAAMASTDPRIYCSCHYGRLLSFSICRNRIKKRRESRGRDRERERERPGVGARGCQRNPFYGKLCCILSGNDARPAAAHPVHKMAMPCHHIFIFYLFICFCFFLSLSLKIFAYSSKQNTNFPQQRQTNGELKKSRKKKEFKNRK